MAITSGDDRRLDDHPAWYRARVVHQVHPRSFADSDGDGALGPDEARILAIES